MKTIKDIKKDIKDRPLLIRVDFNVPMDRTSGRITNDMRIRNALSTIQYAVDAGARVILMSHLGRPKGERKPELSMKKVADRLREISGLKVSFAPECIGSEAEKAADKLASGEVLVLENLRYHEEEKNNDPVFAARLAKLADFYVNDAFGTAHRAHASTEGVTRHLPSVAGFLIEKEVQYLQKAIADPDRPFVAVMGGAKVSDKIEAIHNLLQKADSLLIGGAMAYTFLKFKGISTGRSMVEEDKMDLAGELLEQYGEKICLPRDHVCAREIGENAEAEITGTEIPDGLIGLDIGPQTVKAYAQRLMEARLVTWNGPMGYFELEKFAEGTSGVAKAIAESPGTTIIGGGETAESIENLGLQDAVSHISTGGGACLDYLAGKSLPGIEALTRQ